MAPIKSQRLGLINQNALRVKFGDAAKGLKFLRYNLAPSLKLSFSFLPSPGLCTLNLARLNLSRTGREISKRLGKFTLLYDQNLIPHLKKYPIKS